MLTNGTQSYDLQVKSWGSILRSSCLVVTVFDSSTAVVEGGGGDAAGEFWVEGRGSILIVLGS